MAERFAELNQQHRDFIVDQHIYFVGTAAAEGHVNVSPKGTDTFRVIDANTVAWMNLTGSGNETAAHLLDSARMTVMFCSFDRQPLILRLYGQAQAVHPRDKEWTTLSERFPGYTGARQIFVLNITLVQTSCGYAVPFYDYTGERPTLTKWADNRGRDGIRQYWLDKNTLSLDGRDTGINQQ